MERRVTEKSSRLWEKSTGEAEDRDCTAETQKGREGRERASATTF